MSANPSTPTRRRLHGRVLRIAAVAATCAAMVLSQSGSGRQSLPSGASARTASTTATRSSGGSAPTSATQVTAHDGKFWQGSNAIVLKGFNSWVRGSTLATYLVMSGWGANFIRLHLVWSGLEPNAPVKQTGGIWKHTYDETELSSIKAAISFARTAGLNILLEGSVCNADNENCPYFGFPDWLYQAPYNSHGITYPQTPEGLTDAVTNFWTDPLQQQFMTDFWTYVAGQMKDESRVVGYELMNEPNMGSYPNEHTTTQMSLDFQWQMALAVRAADPARVIFFMSRGAYGAGLPGADLSKIQALGNVAFDVHDYIGARWGSGLLNDPHNAANLEQIQILLEPSANDPSLPFVGSVPNEERWLTLVRAPLQATGIPLLVGEYGDDSDDPSISMFYGTATTALNALGLSWCAWYNGTLGIVDSGGNLLPWGQLVLDAL